MEREVLRFFLNSGPVRKLDISSQTRKIQEQNSPDSRLLFDNVLLNNSILLKCVCYANQGKQPFSKPISTLVFIPYDHHRPTDGGESFIFSQENFWKFFDYKIHKYNINTRSLIRDYEKLVVLDSVPTFSPFLIAMAFERAGLLIPDGYLDLPIELKMKLTAHLKSRIRPLIVAAYNGSNDVVKMENAVEEITNRIFCARHAGEIMPLVKALRLPVDTAHELVQSWVGIAYFEHEYAIMQPMMKRFALWLAEYGNPKESLSTEEQVYFTSLRHALIKNIRNNWNDAVNISTSYRKSYDDLLKKGMVSSFRTFLIDAKMNYWAMAELLGRIEQSIIAWRQAARNYSHSRMPYAYLLEFFSVLRYLNTVDAEDLSRHSTNSVLVW